MEYEKLKFEEINGYETTRLRELELDIRKQIIKLRMDIYTPPAASKSKIRKLRHTLARILTSVNGRNLGAARTVDTPTPAKKSPAKAAKAAPKKTAAKKVKKD